MSEWSHHWLKVIAVRIVAISAGIALWLTTAHVVGFSIHYPSSLVGLWFERSCFAALGIIYATPHHRPRRSK